MVGVRGGEGVAIVAYGKIKIPIAEKLWRTLGPLAESRMWKTSCGPKQDQRSLRLWATAGFRQPAGTEFRLWIGSGPICCAVWVSSQRLLLGPERLSTIMFKISQLIKVHLDL